MLELTSRGGEHAVEAVVSPRAAALRALRVDGVDIVEPTTRLAGTPGMAGVVLAPWPNRVEGAVWRLDGVDQRLPVNEPELGNANHGLLSSHDFDVVRHDAETLTLGADIGRRPGYPFDLRIDVTYALAGRGLDTVVAVRNVGPTAAPVAVGAHPYLRIGDVPTPDLRVTIDADHERPLDGRHLPGRRRRLASPLHRTPLTRCPTHATFERAVSATVLRHAITAPDGREVSLLAARECRFTQLWVAPDLPTDDGPRQAVALEPMTAPPNALRSGEGLHWVGPAAGWSTRWRIQLAG